MTRPLKVDADKFNRVLRNLVNQPHIKRDDVQTDTKKPAKLLPPQTSPKQNR